MISISRSLLSQDYSDQAIAVICFVREMLNSSSTDLFISAEHAEYWLFGSSPRTQAHKRGTGLVLQELVDAEILRPVDQFKLYRVNREAYASDGSYILLDEGELHQFQNIEHTNRWGLFNLYLTIIATRQSKYDWKAGDYSQKYLATRLGISPLTVKKYMEQLMGLKFIYYICVRTNVRSCHTIYGRYEDRNYINLRAGNKDGHVSRWTDKANFKRSVAKRYNQYMQDPKKYKRVEELYADVLKYNEMQRPYVGKCEWAKTLDTSVFPLDKITPEEVS